VKHSSYKTYEAEIGHAMYQLVDELHTYRTVRYVLIDWHLGQSRKLALSLGLEWTVRMMEETK